jgi:hypothetical protein
MSIRAIASLTALALCGLFVPPANSQSLYYPGEQWRTFRGVTGGFLSDSPKEMTQMEVDAIRHGTIYVEMSKHAVECLLGFPEKENDWGRGAEVSHSLR